MCDTEHKSLMHTPFLPLFPLPSASLFSASSISPPVYAGVAADLCCPSLYEQSIKYYSLIPPHLPNAVSVDPENCDLGFVKGNRSDGGRKWEMR